MTRTPLPVPRPKFIVLTSAGDDPVDVRINVEHISSFHETKIVGNSIVRLTGGTGSHYVEEDPTQIDAKIITAGGYIE